MTKKPLEITKLLANKVHRCKQSGSIDAKPQPGRPRTGRSKKFINLVKKRLDSSIPRKSLRRMATDFKSSMVTIKRVLNIDLNKKYYREN